jgi:hypothetical protein
MEIPVLNRLLPLPLLLVLLLAFALPTIAVAEDASADLGSGRLVIVPVNLGVRPNPEVKEGVAPVWNEMLQHFGNGERPVTALERNSATILWQEIMLEMEKRGELDVYAAYAEFARAISEQLDYDTIVFPSLVLRAARLHGSGASWDGVRRHVDAPLVGHEAVSKITGPDLVVSRDGLTGEIAAASLHVAVLDSDGKLRFEGAGGLTLLQKLVQGEKWGDAKLGVASRDDAFANVEELREGIVAAFRRPLPASHAE